MTTHASRSSFDNAGTPRRGDVKFHLLHENGDWVLDAREEQVRNVHSRVIAPHTSCSVLHARFFGSDLDVGLKIRRPLELVQLPTSPASEITLLTMVLRAQERDMKSLYTTHGSVEACVQTFQQGYLRLVDWLIFHPGLVVPSDTLNRAYQH